jgi:quercetin dioxygenase-like cupin family protein
MSLKLRRVVTGHDSNGKAVVKIDEMCRNIENWRPGHVSCVVWATDTVPVDNSSDVDGSTIKVATAHRGGTVFRIAEIGPGITPRNHRTDSIDYAVVISGEVDMQLDDGVEVHLRPGDVLVQRGTIHNWVNRGTEPCLMAFAIIDAKPAEAGGKVLNEAG